MKKDTIEILHNFAGINTGMLFRPGNVIRSLSGARTVFARATVDEQFPREFAIYDLPEFLNTLAMFKDPVVTYEDNFIKITGEGSSVKYHYSAPNVIVSPPDKDPAFRGDEPILSFKMTRQILASIEKASSVLRLKEVRFDGDAGCITVYNRDNSGNEFKIDMKDHTGTGSALFSVASLKMLPDDYEVRIDDVAGHFKAPGDSLAYVVVREAEEPAD